MTTNKPIRGLRWMAAGQAYFASCLKRLDDEELHGPSRLPGWSGRHLLSHVGHNARALARLVHWAATGEPTPMYPSPSARTEEIESGAAWPVPRLRVFVESEHERLAAAVDRLTDPMWGAEVVTAQGRTVPASSIPWLRSREVWLHACDLTSGGDFSAFPEDFVDALVEDALTRRTAQGLRLEARPTDREIPVQTSGAVDAVVEGAAVDLARWLTGRGTSARLRTTTGAPPPELPPWL